MSDESKVVRVDQWKVIDTGVKDCQKVADHGSYESQQMKHSHLKNQPWWTKCPKCNLVYEEEAAEVQARVMGSVSEPDRLVAMRRDAAEIPKRYWDADIWKWRDIYPAMKVVARVTRSYCTDFDSALDTGKGMIFTGNPGTGKTHVACAIANHVMSKGATALYSTVTDFLVRVRNTYGNGSTETEKNAYEAFESPDLLILDEIGRNQETEHSVATMFNMIDRRYRTLKPTILITNLDKVQTKKLLGEAIISRFREGGGKMLGFAWPDLRVNEREIES